MEISSFFLPSFVSSHYSGYLPSEILSFMREQIWKGYNVTNEPSKELIYISRQKATKRRIINEAELIIILQQYGFKIIFSEDLTYQQQVQLFYNAQVVVAPHGAGLTNILFCRNVSVLELHPDDIIKSHYFMLCKGLNFKYSYSIGSQSDSNLSFKVNILDVKQKISGLLS